MEYHSKKKKGLLLGCAFCLGPIKVFDADVTITLLADL